MIYKFKSKATADLIVMGPVGDNLLRIVGREPAAKTCHPEAPFR